MSKHSSHSSPFHLIQFNFVKEDVKGDSIFIVVALFTVIFIVMMIIIDICSLLSDSADSYFGHTKTKDIVGQSFAH